MSPAKPNQLLLDLGSRSAKAYVKMENQIVERQITWALLEDNEAEKQIQFCLQSLISDYKDTHQIKAIGTEAMRRDTNLAHQMAIACSLEGISYRTLSQAEEAQLIMQAVRSHQDLDIINVGGGSIQIVSRKTGQMHLLNFGISDLNKMFFLNQSPQEREIEKCITWVEEKLPVFSNSFIYTGGEEKYLLHLGVKLQSGFCHRDDFIEISQKLAAMDLYKLESLSAYDPKWMHGAVASNCIVIACLRKCKGHGFIASDLNIAHGLAENSMAGF